MTAFKCKAKSIKETVLQRLRGCPVTSEVSVVKSFLPSLREVYRVGLCKFGVDQRALGGLDLGGGGIEGGRLVPLVVRSKVVILVNAVISV